MFRLWAASCLLLGMAGLSLAQEETNGARQLYYLATPPNDLPPLQHPGASPSANQAASNSSVGALHLGIRYNVVLIAGSRDRQVSSDHVFKEGDCFAIDLEANRAAYLYALARQSSGSWTPLTGMPGQQQALPAGRKVRIPNGSCFVVHNPPGTEAMFVVLSRDPRDFFELYESVKSTEEMSAPRSGRSETQMANAGKINAAVEHLDQKFGASRDITIAKIDAPNAGDDTGAVYVVNSSKKLSTSLVTKIQIRHN